MDTPRPLPDEFLKELEDLERSYLAETDPVRQSGYGGGDVKWRRQREIILEAIDRDGDILDVGCANGYLLECLCEWSAERGVRLTPYGVDQGRGLIELAKQRLPTCAAHFWAANAWDWTPPRKFRYVYTLHDCVPAAFRREYFARLLEHFVAPGGLLIVGAYGSESRQCPAADITAMLEQDGLVVAGSAKSGQLPISQVAWVRTPGTSADDVTRYYAARAVEYDETAGYTDPAAEELRLRIKDRYRRMFRGCDVLEIACGTGYWTQVVGEVANSVLATDVNPSVLAQAQARCESLPNVKFQLADAYCLDGVPGGFNAALAIWWWSHMPRSRIGDFLSALHGKLTPGATVLFVDQLPAAFEEGATAYVNADGDRMEERILHDGRKFDVVKNFPSQAEVIGCLGDVAEDIRYHRLPEELSWSVSYKVGSGQA